MPSADGGPRERILARIRAGAGKAGLTSDAEIAAAQAHIAQHTVGPLPSITRDEPVARFIRECERLKSSVDQIESLNSVPLAAARFLEQKALEKRMVGWPGLAALDWSDAGVIFENRLANADDLVGITDCFCAIGETGTVLLLSAPSMPKLHALLPETHICVVSRSRIVATMEDAFALLRREVGEPPRSTFFVSGPSRTADIEQTIVIGAHGPYRVHILLTP